MVIQLYHRNLISGTDFDSTISSLGFTTKYRIETYKIKKNLPTMSGLVRARPGSSGLVRARPGSSELIQLVWACPGSSSWSGLLWLIRARLGSSGLVQARPGLSRLPGARFGVPPRAHLVLGLNYRNVPWRKKTCT